MTKNELAKHVHDLIQEVLDLYKAVQPLLESPKPKPHIVGNVVALPGVDLDAARRAQRRRRRP